MLRKFTASMIAALLLTGCGAIKGYEGPELSDEAISLLRGYSTPCSGQMVITKLDGRYSGAKIAVTPGRHTMTIEYESDPFMPDGPPLPGYYCAERSSHTAEFTTRAGRFYRFAMFKAGERRNRLMVLEGLSSDGIKAEPIAARTEQLSYSLVCGLKPGCDAGGIRADVD